MLKRGFDFLAALAALVVLSPVLVPVVAVLALTGEREIFYAQERVGRGGGHFALLKFATMLKNSPNMAGGDITASGDPRILPFGRFLRKTKINELPQLLNILKGDMSVIGYRPLTPRVAALFPASYWREIAGLRPGLSGVGSVVFRNEEELLAGRTDVQQFYKDAIAPHKMALELWYRDHQSFATDVKLILLTALSVVRPDTDPSRWLPGLPALPPALKPGS